MKVDQNAMIKRVSPSPSNKYPNTGYPKSSSQSYDNRVRVSPSPPSNKIPSQNIIGFNNFNQGPTQYGNQSISTSMQQTNISNTATQYSSIPPQQMASQIPMTPGIKSFETSSPMKQMPYG